MAYLKRPQAGEKALQSIYDSVISILDYLPTLTVRGDNNSTYVEHSTAGTIIHVKQNANPDQAGGKTYYAGSGLTLSGNVFNNAHTSGRFIEITSGNQINCTLSGGSYIEITPAGVINYTGSSGGGGGSDTTYTGELNTYNSGWIYVDNSGSNPHLISSNLRWILQLNNYPLVLQSRSQLQHGYKDHFTQLSDFMSYSGQELGYTTGNRGLGTVMNFHRWGIGNWVEDPEEEGGGHYVYPIDGLKVDLTLSGGRFISTSATPVGLGKDSTELQINSLLSGSSGIVIGEPYSYHPNEVYIDNYYFQDMVDIRDRTLLTKKSVLTYDPNDNNHTGVFWADFPSGDSGGTTVIASGVTYPNYQELHKDDYGYVSGIGISFMLPVQSGANVCFYTGAGSDHAFATFAASELNADDQYQRATIYNGEPYQTSAAGWVRLSVFDDGQHQGECLEFTDSYSDSSSWNYSTPLYRFHGFKALSGDGTTIGVTGNTISGKYYGDGTYIQVDGAQVKWIGTIPAAGMGAPDYTKLKVASDPGVAASGTGTTYLVPVKKGRTIHYQTDGNVVVARWAPCEGSTENAKSIPASTPYLTTPEDGWCRFTVMDDGSTPGACLKLIVTGTNYQGELPLHKFSAGLSGAAGIMIENNKIRNMIQPGTCITSSALEDNNHVMTGIAFNLSAAASGDKVLSCSNGTISWETNTAGSNVPTPVANTVLSATSNGTMQWTTNTGGGSTGGGCFWPKYENLCSGANQVYVQQWYTASNGGWLRISNLGGSCGGIYIDPARAAQGVCGTNYIGLGHGNTWIIPVPPGSAFFITFDPSNTECYFDNAGSAGNYTLNPPPVNPNNNAFTILNNYKTSASNEYNNAYSAYENAYECADDNEENYNDWYSYPEDYPKNSKQWYTDNWNAAKDYATIAATASGLAANAASAARTYYNTLTATYDGDVTAKWLEYVTAAEQYASSASGCAQDAVDAAARAKEYLDLAYPS